MSTTSVRAQHASDEGVRWGPTWQRNEDDGFILPRFTLGWESAAWCEKTLKQPDGPNAGDPWRFTDEQLRFWLWMYAVDEYGRFLTPEFILQRCKGWGKDPFGGVFLMNELLGPCRFAGFVDGEPRAKPHSTPWVQTVAVSKDQTRNTMTLLPGFFSNAQKRSMGLEIGKEVMYAANRGRLEAVTSSPRALEGARPTAVLGNETHHWITANGGHEMNAVVKRNLVKSRDGQARYGKITNAAMPGEDSVGEQDYYAYMDAQAGKLRSYTVLYDALEAPADTELDDRESLRRGLLCARGDSVWLDPERHIEAVYDPTLPASQARRFYLNQTVAREDSWIAPHDWDSCFDPLKQVSDGEEIVAFFDGSKSDDSTGLVGCRVSDGFLFVIDVWEKTRKDWKVPPVEVDAAVHRMFDRWDVKAFYCDVAYWTDYIDKWRDELGEKVATWASPGSGANSHPFAWDMRGKIKDFTEAAERFVAEVEQKQLTHDGDKRLRNHVTNAIRSPNRWGVSLSKVHREAARKIDLAVCAVGARKARLDYLATDTAKRFKPPTRRPGRVRSFS